MTVVDALNGLKKLMIEEVASEIKLQKEITEPTDNVEYVNPHVALITLPHRNFIPVDFQAPNILIGFSMGNEKDTEHMIMIRIVCTVYGGNVEFGAEKLPDEKGYFDLLNLIEKIKSKLIKKSVIDEGVLDKDFLYGIYDEQLTYPYWYGYLQFPMQLPIDHSQMYSDFL